MNETAVLARRIERMERHLGEMRDRLTVEVARENWKLEPGSVVLDEQGREVKVSALRFTKGFARPWVWGHRRLSGGAWQNVAKCLMDRWRLADESPDRA